jgi:antitoxin component of RelBE/YafQ-DinJ toxin-antitoxin module
MPTTRVNISVDEEVLNEFYRLANKKGIKLSTLITIKLKEFIEDEKMIEEYRRKKQEGTL